MRYKNGSEFKPGLSSFRQSTAQSKTSYKNGMLLKLFCNHNGAFTILYENILSNPEGKQRRLPPVHSPFSLRIIFIFLEILLLSHSDPGLNFRTQ